MKLNPAIKNLVSRIFLTLRWNRFKDWILNFSVCHSNVVHKANQNFPSKTQEKMGLHSIHLNKFKNTWNLLKATKIFVKSTCKSNQKQSHWKNSSGNPKIRSYCYKGKMNNLRFIRNLLDFLIQEITRIFLQQVEFKRKNTISSQAKYVSGIAKF